MGTKFTKMTDDKSVEIKSTENKSTENSSTDNNYNLLLDIDKHINNTDMLSSIFNNIENIKIIEYLMVNDFTIYESRCSKLFHKNFLQLCSFAIENNYILLKLCLEFVYYSYYKRLFVDYRFHINRPQILHAICSKLDIDTFNKYKIFLILRLDINNHHHNIFSKYICPVFTIDYLKPFYKKISSNVYVKTDICKFYYDRWNTLSDSDIQNEIDILIECFKDISSDMFYHLIKLDKSMLVEYLVDKTEDKEYISLLIRNDNIKFIVKHLNIFTKIINNYKKNILYHGHFDISKCLITLLESLCLLEQTDHIKILLSSLHLNHDMLLNVYRNHTNNKIKDIFIEYCDLNDMAFLVRKYNKELMSGFLHIKK